MCCSELAHTARQARRGGERRREAARGGGSVQARRVNTASCWALGPGPGAATTAAPPPEHDTSRRRPTPANLSRDLKMRRYVRWHGESRATR